MNSEFQFMFEMSTPEGESLGQYPALIDWEPAREDVRFTHLRADGANVMTGAEESIEPVWDTTRAEPYASGARVIIDGVARDFTSGYFRAAAVETSGELVEKGLLKSGDRFHYKLLAFRHSPEREEQSGFTVEDATPPLPLVGTPLAEVRESSTPFGEIEESDFPVVIPQSVLDEVEEITMAAGDVETGGILIGHVHRDAAAREIAIEVTAQIPAQHTKSKSTSLTFTGETWAAVRAAIALRRSVELMLGWWHSHPSFTFCQAECPRERRLTCSLQRSFLSKDDLALHRTVFSKAWHVALLANNADAGYSHALFGWRNGLVESRGFHLRGARHSGAPLTQTTTGETSYATPCET